MKFRGGSAKSSETLDAGNGLRSGIAARGWAAGVGSSALGSIEGLGTLGVIFRDELPLDGAEVFGWGATSLLAIADENAGADAFTGEYGL